MAIERTAGHSAMSMSEQTAEDRTAAVVRSVHRMRENIGDEHPLRDLAQSALLSPFHFHRVFRQLTDATPARFLAACRMAEAKRQLAYSSALVTDICMNVGYSSLGTFTSQFTRLVGVPPRRYRMLVQASAGRTFHDVLTQLQQAMTGPRRVQVVAELTGGACAGSLAITGLFASGIPQERPMACAIVGLPGIAALGDVADGDYTPLAMSFHPSTTVVEAMVSDDVDRCFVSAGPEHVRIAGGRAVSGDRIPLRLRPRRQIDPPLVLALPLLLAEELASPASASGASRLSAH
jgi:AraC-like DNA-binding protein